MLLDGMVAETCTRQRMTRSAFRFSRREVREHTGWGNTQLKLHLHRLEEMEYLVVHRGGRGQSFVYELAYDGQGKNGRSFLPGLTSPGKPRLSDDWSGSEAHRSGGGRGKEIPLPTNIDAADLVFKAVTGKNGHLKASKRSPRATAAARPLA